MRNCRRAGARGVGLVIHLSDLEGGAWRCKIQVSGW